MCVIVYIYTRGKPVPTELQMQREVFYIVIDLPLQHSISHLWTCNAKNEHEEVQHIQRSNKRLKKYVEENNPINSQINEILTKDPSI